MRRALVQPVDVMSVSAPVQSSPPRQLLCCGDATNLDTASNTPYFLLRAGLKRGLFEGGLALHQEQLHWRRRLWNLRQLLLCGKPGGFQYSQPFTKALLAQAKYRSHQPR